MFTMHIGLRTLAYLTLVLVSQHTQAQSDAVCLAAIQVGVTKIDDSSSLSKARHVYHAFCRTEIKNTAQARERATKAGFEYSDVLSGDYKSKDLEMNTSEYFQEYCSDLKDYDNFDTNHKRKAEFANDKVENYLRQC